MKKMFLAGMMMTMAGTGLQTAQADHGWATAGKVLTGVVAGSILTRALDPCCPRPPVYVTPAPVVVQSVPVVVQTAPGVVQPAPVVVTAPVYVAPPPVVYVRPVAVVACPPPVVVHHHFGFRPWHHHPRW